MSGVVPTDCGGGFAIGTVGAGGGTGGGFPLGGNGGAGGTGTGAGAAGVGGSTGGGFPSGGGACGVVVGTRLVCIGGVGKWGVLVEGPAVISGVGALAFPFGGLAGNNPGRAVVGLV